MAAFDPKRYAATPLMIAAANGELRELLQILATGADVNVRDNRGATALMYATMNQEVEIVQLLLDVGADPRLVTNNGMSALTLAQSNGLDNILKSLLETATRLNAAELKSAPAASRAPVHTHYDNLKIARNAPPEIVRAAYRALSQKNHPDRNPSSDAARIMKILNAAYETLSDPEKRRRHDAWIAEQEIAIASTSRVEREPTQTRSRPSTDDSVTRAGNSRNAHAAAYALGKTAAHVFRNWVWYGLAAIFAFIWIEDSSKRPPPAPPLSPPANAQIEPAPAPPSSQAPAKVASTRKGAQSDLQALMSPPAIDKVEPPRVPVKQGVLRRYSGEERIAPLRIVTPAGNENYYVKLVDVSSGKPSASFFIYGGESFETKVPLGTFSIKYATGENWYGEKHLFGKNTRYSEADKTFEFALDGNRISGYTVTLIRQAHGNLQTKSISADQF